MCEMSGSYQDIIIVYLETVKSIILLMSIMKIQISVNILGKELISGTLFEHFV